MLVLAILVALVVIHEFGHFVVARLAGVRVHEFGIGLPPRALTYHQGGETDYTLNWLPLGGFVRLEGEDGERRRGSAQLQSNKPLKVRTIILLAGVAMNLLLAFVIFVFIAGFADPSVDIRVNGLAPATTSGARRAGGRGRPHARRSRSAAPRTRRSTTTRATSSRPSTASSSPASTPARPASPTPGIRYLRGPRRPAGHADPPARMTARRRT